MNSMIYFYSKFTEEFLLLSAAGVFTLLSIYCYHWVIQKRRLGVARSQIPSSVVKSYLSQLINEAEYVRTQLFGMTDGHTYAPTSTFSGSPSPSAEGHQGAISPDLMARVNSLEYQLKEKESLVVNINIEKSKLLEEVEKMKKNPGAGAAAGAGNQDQLTQKIKNLEDRLEEYALFEEDLANLKRLQQENTQLKKKLGDLGGNPDTTFTVPAGEKAAPTERKILAAVPDIAPETPAESKKEAPKHALDPEAIENLLNGTPATPPETQESPEMPAFQASADDPVPSFDDIEPVVPQDEPAAEPEAATPDDAFENLVDSVENSLEVPAPTPLAPAVAAAPADATPKLQAAPAVAAAAPAVESPLANKTDEELLKEFENLLNS